MRLLAQDSTALIAPGAALKQYFAGREDHLLMMVDGLTTPAR